MHSVPEVEITRPYADPTERIEAQYLFAQMITIARYVRGQLVFVDDSLMSGKRRIIWRFKFRNRAEALAFDKEFDHE